MRQLVIALACGFALTAAAGVTAAEDPTAAAKKEVLATLDEMVQAILRKDVVTLDRLYHEDLTYNHSTGASQNKAEIMRAVPSGSFETMRFINPTVRIYGPVAVVQTTTDLRYYPQGVAADRHLNQLYVLLKGSAGWRVVARHTTRIEP